MAAEQGVQESRGRVKQLGTQRENRLHEVREPLRVPCRYNNKKRYHQQYQQQFNQSTHRLPASAGLLIFMSQSYF